MALMTDCRACRSRRMYLFLPLGDHPPANAFLRADQLDEPEPRYALDTHVCLECGLIQVPDVIPSDFFRDYLYVPSASETMHGHFTGLAEVVRATLAPSPEALVVDIGSNDGLFLWKLRGLGGRGLGIEPAANLAELARARGVEVVNEYFSVETATAVRDAYGPAQVIVTTNTFNHIDEVHAFMAAVVILLEPEGTFLVEVPHSGDLIANNEFDTVYHEHVSEFSVRSLVALFACFDMEVAGITRLPIHGGSMRVSGRRRSSAGQVSPRVAEWLAAEQDAGLGEAATYDAFAARVEANRQRLRDLLGTRRAEGRRLAGYGAPAKGNTLLNYCGIGPDTMRYLADRNSLKHGLYSPGMHIPVVPAETVLEDQPDDLLILAWNFSEEIMQQQQEYRRRGGVFILPIPEPRIVG
jgi:SAM-dependent methyltransferase